MAIVGLDVGTSGVKGLALDSGGSVIARASRGYGLSTPRPGWAEQDPRLWCAATDQVLEELTELTGTPSAIGLAGQMHGLVVLGEGDAVLRPAILWNDQRAGAECAEIEAAVGVEALARISGSRALPGFTAPKLMWMREHEPELYARIERVLLPKDYVRLHLCGVHATDVSDASGTLLLDVGARAWSATVLEALELEPRWLGAVYESAQVCGSTPLGVPVVAGAGDQAAGALGVGVLEPGVASVVLGTSGVVFCALDRYSPDPEGASHTFCHARTGLWHSMGVMLSAAGSLQWLARTIAPDRSFAELVEEAAAWSPGAEGLTFLPYLAGERTPHADPDARGSFTGLSLRHDRGALVRAVLEGVCFGLRDCLDVVSQTGASVQSGVLSGGGAASSLWRQIAADILELPLHRAAQNDGAAHGAALLAGVGVGAWEEADAPAPSIPPVAEATQPDPERAARYGSLRQTYRELYPAIASVSRSSAARAAGAPADGP